jgi:hypothetical protein
VRNKELKFLDIGNSRGQVEGEAAVDAGKPGACGQGADGPFQIKMVSVDWNWSWSWNWSWNWS